MSDSSNVEAGTEGLTAPGHEKGKKHADLARAALARGEHVTCGGRSLRKGEVPATLPEAPVVTRDARGIITRAGMAEAIKQGGSVLWNGEVHTSLDALPDEAELARGDEERAKVVRASLDDQIAVLAAQRARLDGPKTTAVHVEAGKVVPHEPEPAAGKKGK